MDLRVRAIPPRPEIAEALHRHAKAVRVIYPGPQPCRSRP